MSLDSLRLKNFQCHERLEVEFDEQVTVFVGSSDKGKSAILRALRWVATNRPAGDAFVRQGPEARGGSVPGACSARLMVDGHHIRRIRGKGRNLYKLDSASYKAFGADVPSDIATLLNIGEVSWQGQHDAPFWLSLSPGQVSRELNQIINLGLIDSSLAQAAQEVRRVKAEVEVSESRLKAAREERDRLSFVPRMVTEFINIEKIQEAAGEASARSSRLAGLVQEGKSLKERGDLLARASLDAAKAIQAGTRLGAARERASRLSELLNKVREGEERCRSTQTEIGACRNELARLMGRQCPLCKTPIRSSPS